MGGPCKFINEEDDEERYCPPCTDNYQIKEIIYEGDTFYSCEQAYQANKFSKDSIGWNKVASLVPNEADVNDPESFGLKSWRAGNSIKKFRENWDACKLFTMLNINRAKYEQHQDCAAELLSTGDVVIFGGPSTSWSLHGTQKWSYWNGKIQMLIREELRPTHTAKQICRKQELDELFQEYATLSGYSGEWRRYIYIPTEFPKL